MWWRGTRWAVTLRKSKSQTACKRVERTWTGKGNTVYWSPTTSCVFRSINSTTSAVTESLFVCLHHSNDKRHTTIKLCNCSIRNVINRAVGNSLPYGVYASTRNSKIPNILFYFIFCSLPLGKLTIIMCDNIRHPRVDIFKVYNNRNERLQYHNTSSRGPSLIECYHRRREQL